MWTPLSTSLDIYLAGILIIIIPAEFAARKQSLDFFFSELGVAMRW
jgi:hypothetical protein